MNTPKTRSSQLIGLLLWRGGLLIVSIAALYEVGRQVLRFVELPVQLEIAGALGLAGIVLVFVSLIMERIQDSKVEGDLSE